MIFTITANPAIDYHYDLSRTGFTPGRINRSEREEMFPGGKGLNVSVVLSQLGIESMVWGFIAGKTGTLLETIARERGCSCDFITLPAGETRINVKLDCEQETAVNGTGPEIMREQVDALLEKVRGLTGDDILVLSGNLQAGGINMYETIAAQCAAKGIPIIVDTEAGNLRRTFPYHPFLIKPNEDELLGLYESTDRSTASIVSLMTKCRADGVRNILVTMGADGALLLTEEDELYHAVVDSTHPVVSTVGAGDSAVAGFLAGMQRYGGRHADALRLACAAGSATACTKWLCTREEAEAMLPHISVSRL